MFELLWLLVGAGLFGIGWLRCKIEGSARPSSLFFMIFGAVVLFTMLLTAIVVFSCSLPSAFASSQSVVISYDR